MPKPPKHRRRKPQRLPGVDSKGYLVIKAGPQRDVRVHTLVAEAMLGRKLEKHEDVHHRNGNKLDCDWRNLEVLGHTDHGAYSAKQHWFVKTNDIKLKKEWDSWFDGEGSSRKGQNGEEGDTSFP